MAYEVNGDKVIETYSYRDENDYTIEIGTHVGFAEEYDKENKTYIVLDLPNLANTVIMTRILYFGDETGNYVVINPNCTIEVESYKIGAI